MAKTKIKIWRVSPTATAGMQVTQSSAMMIGSEKTFIAVDELGATIAGPVNFMTTSENIRISGVFVKMNDFVKMVPSSLVTPIPENIPVAPVALAAHVALMTPIVAAFMV